MKRGEIYMSDILNRLTDDWKDIKKVILCGWGTYGPGPRILNAIQKDFEVVAILDNDPQKYGKKVENSIPVLSFKDAQDIITQYKIIITTYTNAYNILSALLEQVGLQKYKDYCKFEHFIVEWYWRFRGKIHMFEVHTSVTTRCTLQCVNCNMFTTYQKRTVDYTFDQIKKEVDLLFKHVDYIYIYEWLGGEAFLNKEFAFILDYIGNHYRDRIGQFGIITNGTVLPKEDNIWHIIKKHNILVTISDYTKKVSYKDKLDMFISKLHEYKIFYGIRDLSKWKDYGFPVEPYNYENIREHMLCCGPMFHGYNDGKLFYCHVSWAAEKAGLIVLDEEDSVDLTVMERNEENRQKIAKYSLGEWNKGYLQMCCYCGGCGIDNKAFVDAAIQKEKEK